MSKRRSIYRYTMTFLHYVLMILVALVFILPLWWILITSFKFEGDVKVIPPDFIPNPGTFQNYKWLISKFNFGLYFVNSIQLSIVGMIGQLFSCSLGAYAFARLKFPLKRTLFLMLLSTLMIPGQVTIIPSFLIFNALGFVNTYIPLMLPPFLGGAFGIFLLRQFFLTIPLELEDAAKIDGCSTFRIYANIFLPISKPVLATLGIFTFMNHWNDLFGPIIYLSSPQKRTITVAMALFQDSIRVNIPVTMCAAVISAIPLLLIYMFAQKYFVQGLITSGLKG